MNHEIYMQRALELAKQGEGNVSPNPLVGAVVVYQQRIIGEGYHQKFGEAHAEVNAINQVKNKELLPECTVYVTLEPCNHFGKTPPCSHLLVRSGVKHVVIGMVDPNPLVAGKGIAYLKEHGVEVNSGVLQKQCEALNKRFITYYQKQRPYIILKWAQSADGFIAPERNGISQEVFNQQRMITGELAQMYTHQLRGREDAIMVGTNTAINDNPQLNTRKWKGRNPVRVVLDVNNRIPTDSQVFDGSQPTIVFTGALPQQSTQPQLKYIELNRGEGLLTQIITHLYQQHMQSVIVEGGTKLLQTFINAHLWDETQVFTAPKILTNGVKSPVFEHQVADSILLGDDQLNIYYSA